MATRILGGGVIGTVSDNKVTFARQISGDGLTNFTTADRILNLDKAENKALAAMTKNPADRNKVVDASVASIGTWATNDHYALMKDTGTTTFATSAAALSGIGVNDTIIRYPFDDDGLRVEDAAFNVAVSGVTYEVDTIGEKNIQSTAGGAGNIIVITNDAVVTDMIVMGAGGVFDIHFAAFVADATGLTAGYRRCISLGANAGTNTGGAFDTSWLNGNFFFENCLSIGMPRSPGGAFTVINGTVDFSYCAAVYPRIIGFKRFGGTLTVKNCIAFGLGTGFDAGITQSFNISSDGTASGTGSLLNQTLAQLAFAHDVFDNHPTDWRIPDSQSSVAENAGTPISGITLDIDGRTRDATNPNIGPTEGLTGFGIIGITAPAAPVIS